MSARDPKKYIRVFGDSFKQCSPQVSAYGTCILGTMERTQKDSCLTEWQALQDCLKKSVSYFLYILTLKIFILNVIILIDLDEKVVDDPT